MRKDPRQRRLYASRRMSLAVDRMIRAKDKVQKDQAARWVTAWATAAGIRPVVKNP